MNARDGSGWTPLHDAVYHGNFNCALVLLSAGADPEAETDDFTSVIEMTDDDKMLLVVGRALILAFNSVYQNEISFCEQEVHHPVFDPDRETCV